MAEEGRGLVKDNDITSNAKVGAVINSLATPTFIGNRIMNGQSAGVLIHDSGAGVFVANDVRNNALGGFIIRAKVYEGLTLSLLTCNPPSATLRSRRIKSTTVDILEFTWRRAERARLRRTTSAEISRQEL